MSGIGRLRRALFVCLAAGAAAGGCSAPSRQEILQTAERYVSHRWRATAENRYHGVDSDSVRVDTPDSTFYRNGWRPGRLNTGVPYAWGGFSSLEKFDRDVAKGRPAGHVSRDVDWDNPPRHSDRPIGVDCSGFVSRCWDLSRRYSTRELPDKCRPLRRYQDLLPGDILIRPGRHVMLFQRFTDRRRTQLRVYEALLSRGRCVESTYRVATLRERGYRPMRYKKLEAD